VESTTQVEVEQPDGDSDSDGYGADFDRAICPATHARNHESERLGRQSIRWTEALNLWIGDYHQGLIEFV
jgi:hypothetical protein